MFKKSFLLFIAGCFSLTQIKIIGYLGVAELVFYVVAPFLFVQNRKLLSKHGFTKVLLLAGLWMVNGLITDWMRQNSFENTIRGFAAIYSVISCLIVLHHLLWEDVWRIRWILLGFTVSVILSLFWLQGGTFVEWSQASGTDVTDFALGWKLTLVSIVTSLLVLPIIFRYLEFPFLSVICVLGSGFFGLFHGGRSTFLIMLLTAGLMLMVRNNPIRMRRIHRAFFGLAIGLIIMGMLASATYKYVVLQGMMGEEELTKYETQSESKIGLLSGRAAFIGSVLAIKDSPILGYGSWARDIYGYTRRAADIAGNEYRERAYAVPYMPGHSHVFGAWVTNGIFGGVFWIYILYVVYKTIKFNMGVSPRLFGYLAWTIPAMAWNIFFSPFAARPIIMTAITVMLLLEYYRQIGAQAKRTMPINRELMPWVNQGAWVGH